MIILFIIIVFVILLIILSWMNMVKMCRKTNIPGPPPIPIIGNAHKFIVDSSKFMHLLGSLSSEYGDAIGVHLLHEFYVILSHPKYIEPLVSSSELITKGNSYNYLHEWLGQGLLTAGGERWKTHRKFLTPAFHFNILQNFLPVFCKNGKIYRDKIGKLANGTPVDLFPITALVALDNVTESIMGVSVNAQENSESEYVKAIEHLTQIMALRMQVPFYGIDFIFNLSSYKTKQTKALSILHRQTNKVIKARRDDLNKMNKKIITESDDIGIKNKHAFLDLLLLANVDGKQFDDTSIREEVDTFMFEGHDTTTSGIVFSLFCISKYEEVQRKIFEEQMDIFNGDMDRDPTFNELHQMKYLEMVLKESQRIYPPVPLIERKITKDSEVGSLTLLKGTSVVINIFQMQRNPLVFEKPLEFRPERFDHSVVRNPFSWLVFSAGPRNCIGQKFAVMELKVTISAVIRQFKLLPVDEEPILCTDLILRSKNGVKVKFIPRT